MKMYYFKKRIKANNITEAIKKEPKADITDVWHEDKKDLTEIGTSAIGFQVYNNEE